MIRRDPEGASRERYDLIVIGGGMYGACAARDAALRGLRPLLLERSDFGGATSWNYLRFIHGGLRYLQSADLIRFHESVKERRWFLRTFPDLVRPMPCLLPLYGEGLRRRPVFRAALWWNDLFSARRNAGVREDRRIPRGSLLHVDETVARFPSVRREGLEGAGLWYDGFVPNPQRLLSTILRSACRSGATALNYVEARSLVRGGGRVEGVRGVDRTTGREIDFRGGRVLSCAGPWCRALAASWSEDRADLFRPSIAFNLLLDREPLSDAAVAVSPPRPGARIYFLLPQRSWILAGTYHAPRKSADPSPEATEEEILRFLADLNDAVPAAGFRREDVLRSYSGLLPVKEEGTVDLATRPVIRDHRSEGGPEGFFTLSGVKVTTARRVAAEAVSRIFPSTSRGAAPPVSARAEDEAARLDLTSPAPLLDAPGDRFRSELLALAREESAVYPEDLVYRRTDWGASPGEAEAAAEKLRRIFHLSPGAPLPEEAPE